MSRYLRTLLAVALLWAIGTPSWAQAPTPPPFYAIENAKVVVGDGRVFDRATVLVGDGLIEAVGVDLEIPGDVAVLDGEGLVVMPGLFDALTSIGVPEPPSSAGGRGGSNDAPPIRGPEDRPSTTPWIHAADGLDATDSKIERWRDAGFTHVVTAPPSGLFAGQAAVIALAGAEADQMILAGGVAHNTNLRSSGGFRNFPGSLMGVLSYFRQVFLDAQHYARALEMYEDDPEGLERPEYDRALEPIVRAMADGTPFFVPADRGRHIDRALLLFGDFGLKPYLVGVQGAYERIDLLERSEAAVIVSLDWPEGEKDRSPDATDAFVDLAHRQLAPSVPSRLAAAGVDFAFTSHGKNASDALDGVRRAVESGLTDEQALAALTTTPARLFGVADQLGTVEAGKIANLVVATDYPWAEGAEIKAVFVDGHRFAERESSDPSVPPSVDASGTWSLTMETPRGSRDVTAELAMSEDGKVTGEFKTERGTTELEDGRVDGSKLSFKMTQQMGPRSIESSFNGEIDGERLEGNLSAGPMSFSVSGERTAMASTEEATTDEAPEEPKVTDEELLETWRTFQGPVSEDDDFILTNATVHTVSGPVIENGSVLVRGGKIARVGTDLRVPRGVREIDATGKHVIPGIIDAHSHLAIEGGTNEGSLAVTSMVGTDDVIDPDDIGLYRALAGGVTAANILHGSANPIGGRNQVIKLRWGQDAETMKMAEAPTGIKFALGENPKRSRSFPGMNQRYPATRMGVIDVIRAAFTEARQYQRDWAAYRAASQAGRRAIPPRTDLELQSLAEILDGERLVHTHSYRADEILQMLRVAEEQGFTVATLQHVLEGYKVADEIAKHGAGASTFSDWWGYKVEAYDAIPHNAALMAERGVLVSINSDSAEEIRHLNHEAAKAVRWGGMSDNDALALITLNPAIQLGIDEWVGSIEEGKDADLTVYDGHPLSVRSVVEQTFVDGKLYFDLGADRERQATLEDIKDRMTGGDEDESEGSDAATAESTPDATPKTTTMHPDLLRSAALFDGRNFTYSCRHDH